MTGTVSRHILRANSSHDITAENSTAAVKSYVLALGFTEQLSTGAHSLLQLGTLASDWERLLVEPMVARSHIFGAWDLVRSTPGFETGSADENLPFFSVYDQVKVNHYLHSRLDPRVGMVEYGEFLSTAPKDVTLIHFVTKVPSTINLIPTNVFSPLDSSTARRLRKEFKNKASLVLDCMFNSAALDFVTKVEERLNEARALSLNEQSAWFNVSQLLCLDTLSVYSSEFLSQYIKQPSTVIFTNWCGCGVRNCTLTATEFVPQKRPLPTNFRYAVLTRASCKNCTVSSQHELHSSLVREAAAVFLSQQLQMTRPFLAVHVRLERVIEDGFALDAAGYVIACLKELKEFVERNATGSKQILLITDVGKQYGSDSCNKQGDRCNNGSAALGLKALDTLGLARQQYVPETLHNSAFVSLVEMHALAAGEQLVMVGRGGFQRTLESLYLALGHSRQDIHLICSTKPNTVPD